MAGPNTFLTPEQFARTVGVFQSGTDAIEWSQAGSANGSTGSPLVDLVRAASRAPGAAFRRENARKKQSMFENNYTRELEELITSAFDASAHDSMKLTKHTATNLLLAITGALARLYENPPGRYFKDPPLTAKGKAEALAAEAAAAAGLPAPGPTSVEDLTGDQVPDDPTDETDPELEAVLAHLDLTDDTEDPESSAYETLARDSNLDAVLQTVERLCAVHECVWVRPNVLFASDDEVPEAEGTAASKAPKELEAPDLGFTIYTPANADVLVDPLNSARILAFWYWGNEEDENGKPREVVHLWTATQYQKVSKEWKPIGPLLVNPLGRIPVVKFEIDVPVNGYYCCGTGDDLYAGTLEIAFLKTIQNQRAKDTAFKQFAIQGDADKVPAAQVMGSSRPIMLGAGNTAVVLDLQPYLDQWTALCEARAKDLRDRYGIVVDVQSGAAESGFAIKLKMAHVLKESKRRRTFFAKAEGELYELTAALSGWPELDPEADLVVDFAEPQFDENPEQQAKVDALELEIGALSILDVLKRKNPDLCEADLARLAWRNAKINEALLPSKASNLVDFLAMGPPPDAGGDPFASARPAPKTQPPTMKPGAMPPAKVK